MQTALEQDFVDIIEEGHAVALGNGGRFVHTPQAIGGHRHALVIELGARAAYDLIFGYDGPTKEAN